LRTAGRVISDNMEKKIAFFFIMNGTWQIDEDGRLDFDEAGLPTTITYTFGPEVPPEDEEAQPFSSIGYLSQMFSNHFNRVTLDSGGVVDFGRDKVLLFLSSLIPHDYKGQSLRLWRFLLQKGKKAAADGDG